MLVSSVYKIIVHVQLSTLGLSNLLESPPSHILTQKPCENHGQRTRLFPDSPRIHIAKKTGSQEQWYGNWYGNDMATGYPQASSGKAALLTLDLVTANVLGSLTGVALKKTQDPLASHTLTHICITSVRTFQVPLSGALTEDFLRHPCLDHLGRWQNLEDTFLHYDFVFNTFLPLVFSLSLLLVPWFTNYASLFFWGGVGGGD